MQANSSIRFERENFNRYMQMCPSSNHEDLTLFGQLTYYYVKDGNLDPKHKKAFFAGHKVSVKSYKIWDPTLKKMIMSCDMTFDEVSNIKSQQPTKDVLNLVENMTTILKPLILDVHVETLGGEENIATKAPITMKRF